MAAVLQAAAREDVAQPVPTAAKTSPIPLAAYVLLAAVLVGYVAAVSSLQGMFGGGAWLATLVTQLLAVSELVVGRPATAEPLALVWSLLQRAPWLALLPVAWYLWERDRTPAPVA